MRLADEVSGLTFGEELTAQNGIPSSSEEAGEQVSVNPLVPLRIASGIGLLILGFEDTHDLALGIPREVASRAALRDHPGMHALRDSGLDACHDILVLVLGHDRLGLSQRRGRQGSHAFRGLEDGVVNLEPLLLRPLAFPASPEATGDFICPALETRVDRLQVDA